MRIGKAQDYNVYLFTGLEAVRGVIGREEMLRDSVFVFRDCPMVHTWFVRGEIGVWFFGKDGVLRGSEVLVPWRFSGIYKLDSICLESHVGCAPEVLKEVLQIVVKIS